MCNAELAETDKMLSSLGSIGHFRIAVSTSSITSSVSLLSHCRLMSKRQILSYHCCCLARHSTQEGGCWTLTLHNPVQGTWSITLGNARGSWSGNSIYGDKHTFSGQTRWLLRRKMMFSSEYTCLNIYVDQIIKWAHPDWLATFMQIPAGEYVTLSLSVYSGTRTDPCMKEKKDAEYGQKCRC